MNSKFEPESLSSLISITPMTSTHNDIHDTVWATQREISSFRIAQSTSDIQASTGH